MDLVFLKAYDPFRQTGYAMRQLDIKKHNRTTGELGFG